MKPLLLTIAGVVAGIALSLALVIAVEGFSSIVHPLPEGFTGDMDEMCRHVARYPHWVLGAVVLLWSATGAAGTWLAAKIGRWPAGAVVAAMLFAALVLNISMLPYTLWFKIAMLVCLPAACYWGAGLASRRRATA